MGRSVAILVERDVPVPMRDGVTLSADVYRPAESAPAPVLVQRTPYGHGSAQSVGLTLNPLEAATRGYVVVAQDVRGRYRSEGVFTPFVNERDDGYDTVEWAARQSWSNGRVGVFGSSYMGVTALQAIVSKPPHLTAGLVYLTGANYADGWVYTGGALELMFNLRWTLALLGDVAPRTSAREETKRAAQQQLLDFLADPRSAYARDAPEALLGAADALLPHWREWLDHPEYDEYWAKVDALPLAPEVETPVLVLAGWHDGFLRGGIDLFAALPTTEHRLIVGPWDHAAYLGPRPSSAGERDFGPSAAGGAAALAPLVFSWFDRWTARTAELDARLSKPVRFFLMGANEWRVAGQWPPPEAEPRSLYLKSDGTLSTAGPTASQPPRVFLYDPRDPVPTVGGRHLGYGIAPAGVAEQSSLDDRADVLRYIGDPLQAPLTVTGRVRVGLVVSSSASEADFTAKLIDVDEQGKAWNVADGIVRARELPPQPSEVEIDLWDTAYVFDAGHRVRLDISSSNFPRFDRGLNGAPRGTNPSEVPTATETIHSGALILPLAPL